MLVLKIIGVVVVLASLLYALFAFDEHCFNKFKHKFFNKNSFVVVVVAFCLIIAGESWRAEALKTGGDELNGIVLMVIGVVTLIALLFYNLKKTNVIYGIGGTSIQLLLFAILAYFGIFVLMFGFIISIITASFAKPVYVINK